MSSVVPSWCGQRAIIFSEHDMIFTFILAISLAISGYFLGAAFVKVALYAGIAKVVVLLAACWAAYWLYRRVTRGRRGGVRRIPPL
jgi:hypothetical protein